MFFSELSINHLESSYSAIEICELTAKSDYQFLFEISPLEAAFIQLNAKTILHRTGILQLKVYFLIKTRSHFLFNIFRSISYERKILKTTLQTDNNGQVCIFGNGASIRDAYDAIVSILRKASFGSSKFRFS